MIEADFYADINSYYERTKSKIAIAWEAKYTHGKALPFRSLSPHQELKLLKVKRGGHSYKIPDTANGGKKPYDGFYLPPRSLAVVIAIFGNKRHAYEIDIWDWCNEANSYDRKSLTELRADQIGRYLDL